MSNKANQRDFVNGVPELLLLRLLSRQAMHGYDLVQAIRQSTDQALDFGEGCIYPLLHRLEAQQFLSGRRQEVNGRSRVVYSLTDNGRRQLEKSAALWNRVAQAVNQVLQGEWHGQPAAIWPFAQGIGSPRLAAMPHRTGHSRTARPS